MSFRNDFSGRDLETHSQFYQEGLRGGVLYRDRQFDDARLSISLAQTALKNDAVLCNYSKVIRLLKEDEEITGAQVQDVLSGEVFDVRAKVVINCTGGGCRRCAENGQPCGQSDHSAIARSSYRFRQEFFAGLRPLTANESVSENTKEDSRQHKVLVSLRD